MASAEEPATSSPSVSFPITGDPAADRLLVEDPFALVVGMLFDQQVPLEWAFAAPARLAERLGDRFSPSGIAGMAEDELVALCVAKPAVHRYPAAMARRLHALALHLVQHHGGRTEALWQDASTGEALHRGLREVPGFGDEKARILVAVLGKRFGVRPAGWVEACAPFGDDEPRSAADVASRADFARVKAWKQAMRARGLGKADAP